MMISLSDRGENIVGNRKREKEAASNSLSSCVGMTLNFVCKKSDCCNITDYSAQET